MKSPILILFIILNLLAANFASATSMHVEESKDSHQALMLDDSTQLSDTTDADCGDHSCHFSIHLLGFITESGMLLPANASTVFSLHDDKIHSLNLDTPVKPPKA